MKYFQSTNQNEEDIDIIEQTKEFFIDAENSLKLTHQGQEKAIFFQLVGTNESVSSISNNSKIKKILQ